MKNLSRLKRNFHPIRTSRKRTCQKKGAMHTTTSTAQTKKTKKPNENILKPPGKKKSTAVKVFYVHKLCTNTSLSQGNSESENQENESDFLAGEGLLMFSCTPGTKPMRKMLLVIYLYILLVIFCSFRCNSGLVPF